MIFTHEYKHVEREIYIYIYIYNEREAESNTQESMCALRTHPPP